MPLLPLLAELARSDVDEDKRSTTIRSIAQRSRMAVLGFLHLRRPTRVTLYA